MDKTTEKVKTYSLLACEVPITGVSHAFFMPVQMLVCLKNTRSCKGCLHERVMGLYMLALCVRGERVFWLITWLFVTLLELLRGVAIAGVGRVGVGCTEPIGVLHVVGCIANVEGASLFSIYFLDKFGRYTAP